ncbi:hypothetical protein M3Y94_00696400 [Aphelenchoides besseyi]|nr:hypothetical protein M3Y94_00696400 [Aphelenchoides besseyi]KAI6231575.1 hypothetical protein M3Y95_00396400 [Aphelenchoides besseyi]
MEESREKTKNFLRNHFFGTHLHVEGNEFLHGEFIETILTDITNQQGYELVVSNLRGFSSKDPERVWTQRLYDRFDFSGTANLRSLAVCFDDWHSEDNDRRCVIVLQNAEELGAFVQKFTQQLFSIVHERLNFLKLITLSHMSWEALASSMIKYPLRSVSMQTRLPLSLKDQLKEEIKERGWDQNRKVPLLNVINSYMPRNLTPMFLNEPKSKDSTSYSEFVYDFAPQPSEPTSYQTMSAQSTLLLMAAYFASYNPKDTDERFFGEKGSTKRPTKRLLTSSRPNLHELGPKSFHLDRLSHLYSRLCAILLLDDSFNDLNLKVQIPFLLHTNYLERTSNVNNLTNPKFRCSCSLASIEKISNLFVEKFALKLGNRSDKFRMKDYLLDFALENQAR